MLRGRWSLGGMAAIGVVVTHAVTFLAAAPDPHARAELLARTGHFSFTLASAAVLALVVTIAVRLLPARGRWLSLVAVQTVAWLAVESAERLSHAHADWELGVIALGVVVQAVLALVAALLLKAARRVVAYVTRRRRAAVRPADAVRGALRDLMRPPTVLAGAAGVRGPPIRL